MDEGFERTKEQKLLHILLLLKDFNNVFSKISKEDSGFFKEIEYHIGWLSRGLACENFNTELLFEEKIEMKLNKIDARIEKLDSKIERIRYSLKDFFENLDKSR